MYNKSWSNPASHWASVFVWMTNFHCYTSASSSHFYSCWFLLLFWAVIPGLFFFFAVLYYTKFKCYYFWLYIETCMWSQCVQMLRLLSYEQKSEFNEPLCLKRIVCVYVCVYSMCLCLCALSVWFYLSAPPLAFSLAGLNMFINYHSILPPALSTPHS